MDPNEQDWSIPQEAALLLEGDPREPPKGRARTLLRDILDEHRRKDALDGRSGSIRGTGCLTEAWISGQRFGWVDLQAGPFEWGPAYRGGGYKSAKSEILPHQPRSPQSLPSQRNNDQLYLYDDRVKRLRSKIGERTSVLDSLAVQMGCEKDGGRKEARSEPGSHDRSPERHGVAEVACDEVVSQRDYLRGFQTREAKAIAELEVAALTTNEEVGNDGDRKVTPDDLRIYHIQLLESVVNAVAPATESDPFGTYGSSTLLDRDTRELLTRLAALISSLTRSAITPFSALPLSRPPLNDFSIAYAGGRAYGSVTPNRVDNAGLGGS